MKTIRIQFPCMGLDGCKKNVKIDYNIDETSYEKLMNDDLYQEMSTLFGVHCPICHSEYMFKPSRLKMMILA